MCTQRSFLSPPGTKKDFGSLDFAVAHSRRVHLLMPEAERPTSCWESITAATGATSPCFYEQPAFHLSQLRLVALSSRWWWGPGAFGSRVDGLVVFCLIDDDASQLLDIVYVKRSHVVWAMRREAGMTSIIET